MFGGDTEHGEKICTECGFKTVSDAEFFDHQHGCVVIESWTVVSKKGKAIKMFGIFSSKQAAERSINQLPPAIYKVRQLKTDGRNTLIIKDGRHVFARSK